MMESSLERAYNCLQPALRDTFKVTEPDGGKIKNRENLKMELRKESKGGILLF